MWKLINFYHKNPEEFNHDSIWGVVPWRIEVFLPIANSINSIRTDSDFCRQGRDTEIAQKI
jgi:hypothetical protein